MAYCLLHYLWNKRSDNPTCIENITLQKTIDPVKVLIAQHQISRLVKFDISNYLASLPFCDGSLGQPCFSPHIDKLVAQI